MFKIGEFSKLTRVSVRMLRHYDQHGLLRPARTDPHTGYRLYGADQIQALNRIVLLRDLGFRVAEIAAALERWDSDSLEALLAEKRREAQRAIHLEQRRLERLEQARSDLRQNRMETHCSVAIKEVPQALVLSLRRVIPDYYAEGTLWKELEGFVCRRGIAISTNTFSIYHDREYRERDVDVELCAPVAQLGENREGFVFRRTEAVPLMACSMVCGPFENISGAYLALADWLGGHPRYRMTGESRQMVHRGPWNEGEPAAYLTEIQVALEERRKA